MKKFKLLSLLLVSVSMLTISCQKEGPQGPAGPQGSTGPAGPAGPTGQTGPTGTANVIYSPWQLSGAASWLINSFGVSGSQDADFMYNRTAPGITTSVMNQGVMLCYMRNTGGATGFQINYVVQLPYSYISSAAVDHYDFTIPPAGGSIYFLYKNVSSPLTTTALGLLEFRYIIIPGGVAGGRMRDPRKMSYQEICQAYNIPE